MNKLHRPSRKPAPSSDICPSCGARAAQIYHPFRNSLAHTIMATLPFGPYIDRLRRYDRPSVSKFCSPKPGNLFGDWRNRSTGVERIVEGLFFIDRLVLLELSQVHNAP